VAHKGELKLVCQISLHFSWPKLQEDVQLYVSLCDICQKSKHDWRAKVGLLIPNKVLYCLYE
ncbi:hypothetical protein CERSUDRAFT_60819, partial [Gelatoporia subvermispora B]